ncbi:MAG: thioredoxin family protein [Planctomycetota bacterium]
MPSATPSSDTTPPARGRIGLIIAATVACAGLAATAHAAGTEAVSTAVSLTGEPEVFSPAGVEADRAAAKETDKLHLVYATAVWCGPCQRMKKTTWVEPEVEQWIGSNAIVTALDVDDSRDTARGLGIVAMPTMILFDGDEELGRATGFLTGERLLDWANSTAGDRVAQSASQTNSQPETESNADMSEMLAADAEATAAFAGEMRERTETLENQIDLDLELSALKQKCLEGKHDDACEAYLWMWQSAFRLRRPDAPTFIDALSNDLRDLAAMHQPTMERLERTRDVLMERLESGEPGLIAHWATLAHATGQGEAVGNYIEQGLDDPDTAAAYERVAILMAGTLRENNRYDLLARLTDPLDLARVQDQVNVQSPAALERARSRFAVSYAIAVLGDNPEVARGVARLARRHDASAETRQALIAEAQRAGADEDAMVGLEIFDG